MGVAACAVARLIKAPGRAVLYPAMYYSQTLPFIAACSSMDGDYAEAHKAGTMLTQNVAPHVKAMPPLEGFMTVPMAVEIRFQKWDQILSMPQPDPSMQSVTVFWHLDRKSTRLNSSHT